MGVRPPPPPGDHPPSRQAAARPDLSQFRLVWPSGNRVGAAHLGLRSYQLLFLVTWRKIHPSRPPRERGVVPARLGPSPTLLARDGKGRSCSGCDPSPLASQLSHPEQVGGPP